MAKQGQHKNDMNDQTKSKGPNRPTQSTAKGWNEHPGHQHEKYSTRARHPRSGRSGSDSNAS